ncbi:MAG TPA: heme ABC exporter ATP-binding protein CcmA [Vicinamibacteria bacterium]|nr:heme ABC exporter ATP-binding protein CcmA [Vicinamibacteria bacterium]
MTTPSPSGDVAVEAHGLSRRYGRRWALADVSFQVGRGSILMITGRNGSGKSTLLRVLATAIRPDHGQARVLGHDVAAAREEVRRCVSLLSHYSYNYEPLSALDNLAIAARFLGRAHSRESLLGLLAEVALAERADDPVSTYSAGMRKRLSLARVLLQDAPLVMLDEPYAGLDPPGFRLVDGLLRRLAQRGSTVLMATHLLEHGASLCDQGIVLEGGRLTWSGPAAALRPSDLGGSGAATP